MPKTTDLTKPHLIAAEFSRILREWLTPGQMKDVISRTRLDSSVCYTHDYCDANMAMDEAMRKYGLDSDVTRDEDGEPIEPFDTAFAVVWNRAWDIAKRSQFRTFVPDVKLGSVVSLFEDLDVTADDRYRVVEWNGDRGIIEPLDWDVKELGPLVPQQLVGLEDVEDIHLVD